MLFRRRVRKWKQRAGLGGEVGSGRWLPVPGPIPGADAELPTEVKEALELFLLGLAQ